MFKEQSELNQLLRYQLHMVVQDLLASGDSVGMLFLLLRPGLLLDFTERLRQFIAVRLRSTALDVQLSHQLSTNNLERRHLLLKFI